jgi:putative copper export protein
MVSILKLPGVEEALARSQVAPRSKGGRASTMENLFKFLHILAVIVWVGGVLTVNVLQVLTGKGHDRAAQASLLRLSDLYGRAVIAPAAAFTLLTGLVRAEQIDVGYGTFWSPGASPRSSCPWRSEPP